MEVKKMSMFIYHVGAWALATGIASAVFAAVKIIESGVKS